MPIWLTTGLPGHGKTLRTVLEVEERRQREGRRVYQHGILELTLPWFDLENPEAWDSVPDGSIVVIDESQRVFPVRPTGAAVPEHVSKLETHRHRGIDLVLITQHPNLLDAHVRRLVERHCHVHRPFGLSYYVLYEWQVATDPQRSGAEKTAQKSRLKLDSRGFGLYKSATQHTVKKRFPRFVLWFHVLGGALGLLLWLANNALFGRVPPQTDAVVSKGAQVQQPRADSLPVSRAMPIQQQQVHPLSGSVVYVVGDISGNVLLQVERDGRAWVVTGGELGRAGYLVEPLNPCMVRLGYMHQVQYALCRGRDTGQPENRQFPIAEGDGVRTVPMSFNGL